MEYATDWLEVVRLLYNKLTDRFAFRESFLRGNFANIKVVLWLYSSHPLGNGRPFLYDFQLKYSQSDNRTLTVAWSIIIKASQPDVIVC